MIQPSPMVELHDVSRHFGDFKAVKNVSFTLPKGSVLTILGPSGCGKTTILRMIAGFESPTSGEIFINDDPVSSAPPHKRSIGMVFIPALRTTLLRQGPGRSAGRTGGRLGSENLSDGLQS